MKKADVTVHIDETLPPERTSAVCDALSHTNGVIQVRCAQHQRHLLVVDFDPDFIGTREILRRVEKQGLHAELIGL